MLVVFCFVQTFIIISFIDLFRQVTTLDWWVSFLVQLFATRTEKIVCRRIEPLVHLKTFDLQKKSVSILLKPIVNNIYVRGRRWDLVFHSQWFGFISIEQHRVQVRCQLCLI